MDDGEVRRVFGSQEDNELMARRLHASKASGILPLVHRPLDFVLPAKTPSDE